MEFWTIILFTYPSIIGTSYGYDFRNDWSDEQCDKAIKETIREDRETVVEETPDRLYSTWVSQECEMRAGPEYVIRKYIFYENGTFLLLRYHYAEESCSIATHTVTARGIIRLLSASGSVPGATTAKYQLNHVHILPLTRQVAQKFGHRVNLTCMLQQKWHPFVPQVIYERSSPNSKNSVGNRLSHNLFQHQRIPSKNHHGFDCLNLLNIDFDELQLIRVQKKQILSEFGFVTTKHNKVELLLGSLPPNVYSRKFHKATSLQPTPLLRSDMTTGCLVCSAILKGSEKNPPLLHELAALPALLGGFWISASCESTEDGLWIRRQFRIFAGDMLWSGRWDYYSDPKCINFLYTISSAGSYIQRADRQKRHGLGERDFSEDLSHYIKQEINLDMEDIYNSRNFGHNVEFNEQILRKKRGAVESMSIELKSIGTGLEEDMDPLNNDLLVPSIRKRPKIRRSTDSFDETYKHILQNTQPSMAESFATILRGNHRQEETTKKPHLSSVPAGTTELDLHVAESVLIVGDISVAVKCGVQMNDKMYGFRTKPLNIWPGNCVKYSVKATSMVGLKARIGVNWSGQYTLLLGLRDNNLWEAPLRQCNRLPLYNPLLRFHLRQSLDYQYGLFSTSRGKSLNYWSWSWLWLVISFWLVG